MKGIISQWSFDKHIEFNRFFFFKSRQDIVRNSQGRWLIVLHSLKKKTFYFFKYVFRVGYGQLNLKKERNKNQQKKITKMPFEYD